LPQPRVHRGLLIKSVAVTLVTVGLFFAGQPIALVALIAAAVLMLDRVRPEKVYQAVAWALLVMFAGLFVVVHAFEVDVVHKWGLERCDALLQSPVVPVSGLSVLLSNLVSNVPAVLLFKPLMEVKPPKELACLALAISSTLGGNLTVLGVGRKPDRGLKRPSRRHRAGLRGIPQGRCATDGADDARRRHLARAGPLLTLRGRTITCGGNPGLDAPAQIH
jgi:hypothetical protein